MQTNIEELAELLNKVRTTMENQQNLLAGKDGIITELRHELQRSKAELIARQAEAEVDGLGLGNGNGHLNHSMVDADDLADHLNRSHQLVTEARNTHRGITRQLQDQLDKAESLKALFGQMSQEHVPDLAAVRRELAELVEPAGANGLAGSKGRSKAQAAQQSRSPTALIEEELNEHHGLIGNLMSTAKLQAQIIQMLLAELGESAPVTAASQRCVGKCVAVFFFCFCC